MPDVIPTLDTLDDPRIEAFGMLIEAHNELQNAVTRRLEQGVGVPVAWLGVLIRLARSPDQRLRMTELAHDMTMSTSGLTRLIDRIESVGHVRREACPGDRRGLLAVLTASGQELVVDAAPDHVADLDRFLASALTRRELDQLTGLLEKVRDHVRSVERGS